VPHAKEMARQTFLWLEKRFASAGFILVDICFFVDFSGQLIYGEISPDCMRVRRQPQDGNLDNAEALDKDLWRRGASPAEMASWYEHLHQQLFGHSNKLLQAS
jgi:phosphoribosylaminoimidazole-succinocarboxamide synthase